MAEDKKEQVQKPNFDNQIDIEALISAPLVAASKANVMMLTGQTRFILEYCFKKDEKGTYVPEIIEMVLSKGVLEETNNKDANGENIHVIKKVEMRFSVPLLTLVPLNSLAVNKVSVDFEIEVTSTNVWNSTKSNNSDATITQKQVALKGKIKSEVKSKYKSSMSSKLKVNIEANPLPLPLGLLSIMDLYTKSIQPLPVKKNKKKNKKDKTN